ncbi:hypothetical protein RB601_007220 [Gaeumannomyces tritici]
MLRGPVTLVYIFFAQDQKSPIHPSTSLSHQLPSLRRSPYYMSMVEGKTSSCCLTGFEWDGTPTGRTEKLGGSDVYVAGANAEAGVLLVHDLFGWTFGNLSLLADQVAREADVTVYIPDLFGGEALPPDLAAAGRFRDLDLPGFMARNGRASREPELFACARHQGREGPLARRHVSGLASASGAEEHRAAPLVDCISIGHPSLATERDFDEVAVPVQILAHPERDPAFTPELKLHAFRAMIKKGGPVRDEPGEREAMVAGKDAKAGGRAATSPRDDAKLTEREIEILSKAWTCMRNQPEIDMNKLADALGMTNVGSATNAWGRIKKKLFSGIPAAAGGGSGSVTATATRKRKSPAKATAADDGRDDEDEAAAAGETPAKKRKAGRPRKNLPHAKVKSDAGASEEADAAAAAAARPGREDDDQVKDEPKPEEDEEDPKKPAKGSVAGFKAANREVDMSGSA